MHINWVPEGLGKAWLNQAMSWPTVSSLLHEEVKLVVLVVSPLVLVMGRVESWTECPKSNCCTYKLWKKISTWFSSVIQNKSLCVTNSLSDYLDCWIIKYSQLFLMSSPNCFQTVRTSFVPAVLAWIIPNLCKWIRCIMTLALVHSRKGPLII